jgi:hypothetical protein
MKSASKIERRWQKVVDRAIRRVVGRFPHDRLIRAMAVLARMSRQSRSTLTHVILEHAQPGWRSLDLVNDFNSGLEVRHFMSALTAGRRELTRPRIALLSNLDRPHPSHLDYVHTILDRRFLEAFDMWEAFPAVEPSLNSLPLPSQPRWSLTMAVVLPGPADSEFGSEIDSHDLVGRTSIDLAAPATSEARSVGTRFDYAFVNWNRFNEISASVDPVKIDADRIVTFAGLRNRPRPPWLTADVSFELGQVATPTIPRTYMPLRIVPWCFRRGFYPTLFCADFYLGSTPYRSADYDWMRQLETEDDLILSYLRHDVFFNHAALRYWYRHGVIHARGRLAEILELDGRGFAEALQERWGSR